MKKSSVVILSVILIVLTVVSTLFVTRMMSESAPVSPSVSPSDAASISTTAETTTTSGKTNDVVIRQSEYDKLKALEEKYAALEELQDYILDNYYKEVSPDLLVEGAKKGVFNILGDPYSVYMNEKEYTSFTESISGEFPGIGVYVAPNPEMGIEVVSPIEDTPAYNAGIKSADIIKAVNGVEYTDKQMDEAIKHIRGEVGTNVTITIYRPSTKETFDVTITRAMIVVKVVKSEMLEDGIGYLRLTQFDNHAYREFKDNLSKLVSQGAKGIVFDLRDNPGGSLDQCLKICDMLLPSGTILSTKGRAPSTNEVFKSDADYYPGDIVVLINGGSASASEIVAGALKDNNRALLVGTKSFGKGIVQTFLPFDRTDGIKLTTSEYFTPSGTNIHGIGITPDFVEELSEEFKNTKNPTHAQDNQLQKALEILKKQMRR
ncbi:MAG: S41 family peptidase [Bacillota bacterium]|nr:S41 family peptidase [Bacillota bacterium]